ncbi:MAG: ABC transporter substrate-binding protein [Chloroflexota bacterium]|nr:ABC transporter substrate-binding protein [Chloroflexota bacterium]
MRLFPRLLSTLTLLTLLVLLLACTRQVEVVKEVPVEVEREVTVEVEREVPVEVERQVMVEVVATPTPNPNAPQAELPRQPQTQPAAGTASAQPTPTQAPPPPPPTAEAMVDDVERIYKIGISEDLTTTNYWAYLGPDGTIWNLYVLSGSKPSLYSYTSQTFDWVPSLASDFPTALTEETVDGQTLWATEVPIKQGVMWSDGNEITAEDFAFTANTVNELMLTGYWPGIVDPEYYHHSEALDPYRLKIYFQKKPGLARWQFGLAFMPIFSSAYWGPVVAEAKQAGEIPEQQKVLYAHVPEGEPTGGPFGFDKWERGAFAEKSRNDDYFFRGSVSTQYDNGAYVESKPGVFEFSAFGDPSGEVALQTTEGPNASSSIYSVYGSQDATVLALKKGDIDFMLNPLGLSKGLQEQLEGAEGLTTIENSSDGVRYLGFNFRREPMNDKAFRQAVATLIDKEFLTQTVLQGVAIPVYAMVPTGNAAWYNSDVPQIGRGLTRAERVAQAVELLKEAGFTWEVEPRVSEDGRFVEQEGEGLRMPNGEPIPEMTVLAPSPGYDPLRSTFAIWIERWLNEVGIPVRADLTGFNLIVEKVFNQQDFDMWILGWGLSLYPDYLEVFFHSRYSELEGYNAGGYDNPEFDRLADDLVAETDLESARDQVFRMQAFLADDLPYVTLFTTPIVETYRSDRIEFPYTQNLGGLQNVAGMPSLVSFK